MILKLFTEMIADGVHKHLEKNELLPEEQKGCRLKIQATKDKLLMERVKKWNVKEGTNIWLGVNTKMHMTWCHIAGLLNNWGCLGLQTM